jgi:uncharacterized membrane protein YraQ (UPF0718 family)
MAALDFARVDTDKRLRVDAGFDPMKLTFQIVAGILIAGAIGWIVRNWMMEREAEQFVEALAHALPALPTSHRYSAQPTIAAPTLTPSPAPLKPICKNFVQMKNGEKHCLEDLPRYQIISAAH